MGRVPLYGFERRSLIIPYSVATVYAFTLLVPPLSHSEGIGSTAR